jgi:hypothetical protein
MAQAIGLWACSVTSEEALSNVFGDSRPSTHQASTREVEP